MLLHATHCVQYVHTMCTDTTHIHTTTCRQSAFVCIIHNPIHYTFCTYSMNIPYLQAHIDTQIASLTRALYTLYVLNEHSIRASTTKYSPQTYPWPEHTICMLLLDRAKVKQRYCKRCHPLHVDEEVEIGVNEINFQTKKYRSVTLCARTVLGWFTKARGGLRQHPMHAHSRSRYSYYLSWAHGASGLTTSSSLARRELVAWL